MLCSKSQYPTSVCHSGINIIKQKLLLLCENDIASALENTGKLYESAMEMGSIIAYFCSICSNRVIYIQHFCTDNI